MKKSYFYCCVFLFSLLCACQGQDVKVEVEEVKSNALERPKLPADSQLAAYVRNILQDKNGDFWFGTNGYGVAHYDGDSVSYYSNNEGFRGGQVTGMSEDLDENIWFATDQGVVKYDWKIDEEGRRQFTNHFTMIFLEDKQFWSVFADSKGGVWAGSVAEIFHFDGSKWSPFKLPLPQKENGDFITNATTWSITEDSKGNMWFSTNGYGAFKYDGSDFTQYSKEDGLSDNSVDVILEDSKGRMWFGTRFGGVSSFDGKTFVNYTLDKKVKGYEVCEVYEDSDGNIWFSSEGYGVYRYDGKNFTNYSKEEGLEVMAPQTIFEDKTGRLWVGGGGGLYKFDELYFTNVKRGGPWD